MLRASLLLLLSLILFTCEEAVEDLSNRQMMCRGSWIVETKTVEPAFMLGGFEFTDILAFDSDSVRNLEYKFSEDGVFQLSNEFGELLLETSWLLEESNQTVYLGDTLFYPYPVIGYVYVVEYNLVDINKDQFKIEIPVGYIDQDYIVRMDFRNI